MNCIGSIVFRPLALALVAAAAHGSAIYEPAPFTRYQPILDRMPFGALPASFNPDAEAEAEAQKSAEQEQLEQMQMARQLGFLALNITPKGTIAVGFIDRAASPPENHYIGVGETAGGWTVVSADYHADTAKFSRDGVTITMHLLKGLVNEAGADAGADDQEKVAAPAAPPPSRPTAAARASRPAASAEPAIPGLVRRSAVQSITGAAQEDGRTQSFLERLRERKAQESAEKSAAEKAARENLQELARKIAQDELAKRDEQTATALEELRLQQELFQARQQEDLLREQAEEQKELLREQAEEEALLRAQQADAEADEGR